jgi:hypothetical protein
MSNNSFKYNCIFFPSYNNGFIAGDSGRVYKTINNGVTWIESIIDSNVTWKDIFFINDSCGFVVGLHGNVYYTSNAGIKWVKQQIPTNNDLVKVVFVSDSIGYICSYWGYLSQVGELGELFETKNRGALGTFNIVLEDPSELYVFPNPNSGIFTVLVPKEFDFEKYLNVKIYDNVGRLIQKQSILIEKKKIKINLSGTPAGIYLLNLSNGVKCYKAKIVKE